VPEPVIGEPVTERNVGTDIATEVTVPVVELVPAPIAVRKSVAFRAETVLSALNLGNVIALGLVSVKTLPPTVVAPRAVRAKAAVLDPVPPCAMLSAVVNPLSEVISLLAPRTAALNEARAKAAVLAPVPPEATGREEASVSDVRWVVTSRTLVPLLNTQTVLPVGTAIPVPVAFLTVIVPSVPLLTIYAFSIAGTTRLYPAVAVPVRLRRRLRAVWAVLVSVSVSVTLALEKATSADPVIASSIAVPILTFVTLPQVALFSPVAINWIFRLLYVLAIFVPYVSI
jgi:hypothetical protein